MGSETVSDPNFTVRMERTPVSSYTTQDALGQHEVTVAHATPTANRWLVEQWRMMEDVFARIAFAYAHGHRDHLPEDVLRYIATETPLAPMKAGERTVLVHRADVQRMEYR